MFSKVLLWLLQIPLWNFPFPFPSPSWGWRDPYLGRFSGEDAGLLKASGPSFSFIPSLHSCSEMWHSPNYFWKFLKGSGHQSLPSFPSASAPPIKVVRPIFPFISWDSRSWDDRSHSLSQRVERGQSYDQVSVPEGPAVPDSIFYCGNCEHLMLPCERGCLDLYWDTVFTIMRDSIANFLI